MIFKIRWERLGGHTHCRLFAAKALNQTYAGCGEFTIRNEEFGSLHDAMSGVMFEEARSRLVNTNEADND